MSASEDFVAAYITAALWSSCGDDPDFKGKPEDNPGGVPLDTNYSEDDIAEDTLVLMRKDCDNFVAKYRGLLDRVECRRNSSGCSKDEQAGHDFWLNRNGHGVGFWDGDWTPRGLAERLSQACKGFGSFDLYVADDGKVHGQ